MKRFTLLMLAFVGSIAMQAQVIYQQPEDTPNGSGIVSDYFDDISAGAFSADDFTLSAQQDLHYVRVYGFQSQGNTDLVTDVMTGFSLYIYLDSASEPVGNPSVPGNGLLEIINIPPTSTSLSVQEDGAGSFTFTIDIVAENGSPLTLSAGTYWVVAVAHINSNNGSGARWNWYASTQKGGTDALIIDPSDIFGGGATTWTPIENLTADPIYDALSFSLYDQNLGVIEENAPLQVSFYPNPVQNQLNIQVPASVYLESATIHNLLGKQTQVSLGENNSIDMSQMAAGVYILKLETNQGSLTKKIIKQ